MLRPVELSLVARPPPMFAAAPSLTAVRGKDGTVPDRETVSGRQAAVLNSTRLGRNPASVLPAPVGAISSTERPARAFAKSSSWCARAVQPRLANQRKNGSGRSEVDA